MSVKLLAKNIIRKLLIARRKSIFLNNQHNPHELSKAQLRRAKRLGFTPEEYAVYNLNVNDPSEYISEFERSVYRDMVKEQRVILDNKVVFYNIIRNFADVNTIWAYKKSGKYVMLEDGYEINSILARLRENGRIVYKKQTAGGGKGFKLLEYGQGQYYINRVTCDEKDIVDLLETDDYLLEAYCVQSTFEDELCPYSVNTLRIITLSKENECKAIYAIQRMGATQDSVVDNAYMGGLYARIDVLSGQMSSARSRGKGKLFDENGGIIEFDTHPVTGVMIKGRVIPDWDSIVKQVEVLHEKLRFTGLDLIAWDIALTEKGINVIEANTSCAMGLLQNYEGMRKKEVGQWMKERGCLK